MDLRPQSKGYSMEDLIQIQCRYLGGGNETGWGEEWELVWNWSRDLFLLESKTTLPPPPLIQLSYSVLTETRRFPCTVKSVSNFHSCITCVTLSHKPDSSIQPLSLVLIAWGEIPSADLRGRDKDDSFVRCQRAEISWRISSAVRPSASVHQDVCKTTASLAEFYVNCRKCSRKSERRSKNMPPRFQIN